MLFKEMTKPSGVGKRAIEGRFPIGFISQLAEHESWRKEVYRPIYYLHKWWARRLGSVFRAIIIASCIDEEQDVGELLYQPVQFPGVVIFDPFMGSGTTVGEAVKLGCRAIGRDINPVAVMMVRAALHRYSTEEVQATFNRISETVGEQIRAFYTYASSSGERLEVLYYFWVRIISCPLCDSEIELFKKRIFAKHVSPDRNPEAKAICPNCRAINDVAYDDTKTTCTVCGATYNPQVGPVSDSRVTCPSCGSIFTIINVLRQTGTTLKERMYAKLVLYEDGAKRFLPVEHVDWESYYLAEKMIPSLWEHIPQIPIQPGYNTDQVINYNYHYWHQMFNARQLACLALLASEIRKIQKPELRQLFACLFSGTLEFNNMFASFKGLGTGAVRHMFAHHILKPELMPLEANLWGTDKSSGSFSTLFETRVLRALDYKSNPFELLISNEHGRITGGKVYGISRPVNVNVVSTYKSFVSSDSVYLSIGDSSSTDLADESVDLVITDPPFFDNVHYSQLADFFYVWLRQILNQDESMAQITTRSPQEVQSTDAEEFAKRLTAVFRECHRVLKANGLLIFTYHHSRIEGWSALYQAIRQSGFVVVKTHPIKSEMAVSVPIQRSKTPINYDLIFVCRKATTDRASLDHRHTSLSSISDEARTAIQALLSSGMQVSVGDIRVILMGCVLSELARIGDLAYELATLQSLEKEVDLLARDMMKKGLS